ncbi:MAG TPA: hypothetical protein VKC65_06780 [Gaiellaceae bacterium]|nr:hypothetical protein [Gaiellaceae bacterium]
MVKPAALNPTSDDEISLSSFFAAFSPAPEWSELARWPPDVFALANLVLDNTGAYRFVLRGPLRIRRPALARRGRDAC